MALPPNGRGFREIGYHYFYERNGTEKKGREENEEGAHCPTDVDEAGNVIVPKAPGTSFNFKSIALCFAGDGDIEYPTSEQIESMRTRILDVMKRYNIPINRVLMHRDYDFHGKTCPGSLINDHWIFRTFLSPPEQHPSQKQEKEEKQKLILQYQSLIEQLLALVAKLSALLK